MLSASEMETWDRCRRAWQFSEEYRPLRVTPLGATYAALRHVLELPTEEYTGPHLAREYVMEQASTRGVQTNRDDPYDLAVHYGHLAEVLARAMRQPKADPLQIHKKMRGHDWSPVESWEPQSYLIDGGIRLMRFALVDRWDDNRALAELHSWRTLGDICVTGLPMTLRVLVIGHQHAGRRQSPWTRAKQHPYTKQIRHRSRTRPTEELKGQWRNVYREDTVIGPDAWVESMARDGVLRECAFDVRVRVPDAYQRERVLEDVQRVGKEMAWHTMEQFPMTRSACDDPVKGPCIFQAVCWAATEITPTETGMFERKEKS